MEDTEYAFPWKEEYIGINMYTGSTVIYLSSTISRMPGTLWMLALSITRTELGKGHGCIWSSTPSMKSAKSSPVKEWSNTSRCRMPSRDNAGKMEYLE